MRDLAFWVARLNAAEQALAEMAQRPLTLRRAKEIPWPPRDPGPFPYARLPKPLRLRLALRQRLWKLRMKQFKRYKRRREKLEKQIAFYKVQIERTATRSHRVLFREVV